tara:strand:+ start:106 stop:225 length:120 start_codon:yes stop_codon:yes gene_type:complete
MIDKRKEITYKELEDLLTNVLGKVEEQDNKYIKQKKENE